MANMYVCTCSVCGDQFMAKTAKATVCIEKSTCRVKASRAKRKAQKEAESMTLDMADYALYEMVVKRNPGLASLLSQQLKQNGKSAMHLTLVSLAYVYEMDMQ